MIISGSTMRSLSQESDKTLGRTTALLHSGQNLLIGKTIVKKGQTPNSNDLKIEDVLGFTVRKIGGSIAVCGVIFLTQPAEFRNRGAKNQTIIARPYELSLDNINNVPVITPVNQGFANAAILPYIDNTRRRQYSNNAGRYNWEISEGGSIYIPLCPLDEITPQEKHVPLVHFKNLGEITFNDLLVPSAVIVQAIEDASQLPPVDIAQQFHNYANTLGMQLN